MARLLFSDHALDDLREIHDYIARDKPTAAARWVERLEEKCSRLSHRPQLGESCPEFGTQIRRSVLGRFVIYFRALADGIEVVRVVAGDREIRNL